MQLGWWSYFDQELKRRELISTHVLRILIRCLCFRFYSITGACYRRALGIMLVYDVTNEASFMNISKWMDKIAENANKEVAKILVANKCDLEGKRKISQEAGESFADAFGISYIEVSALSNRNVEEAFITLARNILRRTSNCRQTESAPLDSEKVGLSSDCKSC